MSVLQTYPFNNSGDYNLSNIEVAGGSAKLSVIPIAGKTFTESFDSATGFTYDNTKAEFIGNLLRQKDKTILPTPINGANVSIVSNSVLKNAGGAAWNAGAATSQTLASGDGEISWNVSTNNTDTMCGLTTSSNPAGNYALLNFAIFLGSDGISHVYESGSEVLGQTGTYTNTDVFTVAIESGSVKYKKNGTTYYTSLVSPSYPLYGGITIYTVGVTIQNFTFLSGYKYVESKADLPNFTYTGVGYITVLTLLADTEVGTPRYIIEGKYWNGSAWATSDGTHAQSSSKATVNSNLSSLALTTQTVISVSVTFPNGSTQASVDAMTLTYTGDGYAPLGYLEPITGVVTSAPISYSHTDTIPSNTDVRVALKVDGLLKYHDGADWVLSDGSEAQSNAQDEINDNLPDLPISGSHSEIIPRWILITDDDTVTPEIEEAILEYEFSAVETDPATCIVFGYYRNIAGEPITGATVTFSLVRAAKEYTEANKNIIEGSVSVTTDSDGYFQSSLIRTSEYDAGDGLYKVVIKKTSASLLSSKNADRTALTFEVPDASSKDITDLLPSA